MGTIEEETVKGETSMPLPPNSVSLKIPENEVESLENRREKIKSAKGGKSRGAENVVVCALLLLGRALSNGPLRFHNYKLK